MRGVHLRSYARKVIKFGNKRVQVDNVWFDSKKEAARYKQLKIMLKSGEITNLELQPVLLLQEGFKDNEGARHRAITYRADFKYRLRDYVIIEDVKSEATKTSVYQLKKKMLIKNLPLGTVFREIL